MAAISVTKFNVGLNFLAITREDVRSPASHTQAAFLRGTFAPFSRASERPIAIACSRLFTVPPLPPLPDFKVPCFFLRIALSTALAAALPYFRPPAFLLELLVVAIVLPPASLVGKNIHQGCRVHLLAATSLARLHQKSWSS